MIITIICFSFIPLIHQLESTYISTKQQLELKRTLFNIIKVNIPKERQQFSKYEVYSTKQQLCIQDKENNQKYCHSTKGVHIH